MPTRDKRHQEVITKIKSIMKIISDDVLLRQTMPAVELPKIGYDNTVWSDQKRMLTIGNKTVQVGPHSAKKIPTFSQYLVMANAVRRLLDEEMESTIRGMNGFLSDAGCPGVSSHS